MAGNQFGRRRPPKPTKALVTTMVRAVQDTDLPEESKEQLRRFAALIEQQVREMNQSSYLGQPAPHGHEDDDSGGTLDDGAELLALLAFQRAGC
jgi:hypothetical protein